MARSLGVAAAALVVLLLLLCDGASAIERARHQVDDVAISDISLLLPFGAKTKVSYEIEAYNGCFKWESSHPEIVSVRPIYRSLPDICGAQPGQTVGQPDASAGGSNAAAARNPFLDEAADEERCSTHAIVTVSQTNSKRAYSWIIAEDTISGRRVRCEVYVDTIQSIQIETTTRTMYHGDVEVLQVQALDAEGNLFSTLEGLQFKWSLVSLNANSASSALQFVRFIDSNIEVSEVMMELEAQGKESHAVLVQGVESGKVNVAARLMESGADVEQHVVTISVLEPLQLTPSHPIYITPGTAVQYELQTYKNDYVRTVSMPNPQYVWLCGNSTVAAVDSAGLVEGRDFGESEVRVQYENMSENSASGEVHVVWPAYISIRVVPLEDSEKTSATPNNWYLISGRRYVITIDVFDVDNYKLYSTKNLDFQVDLGHKRHFTTVDVTENQSDHTVDALKEGLTQVSATLSRVYNPRTKSYTDLEAPLTARQEIVIISELSIEGGIQEVLLPADEACRSQPVQVRASGGSGEHNWYSADPSVASVSAKGFVTPLSEGTTAIMAVDSKNPLNRASVPVMVRKPARIAITPVYREVQVGDDLILPVTVYDKDGHAFSSCSCLPIAWSIKNEQKFAFTDAPYEASHRGCAGTAISALVEGQSVITATYGSISAEILVFAFNPLVVSPESSLVTLGSSAEITGDGGPNPWYQEPGLFEAALYPERPNDVIVSRAATHGNRYAFKVTCKAHGNQTLTLRVGNRASRSNEHPASAQRSVTFMCYPPTSIMLYPVSAQEEKKAACVPSHSCGDSSWVFPTPSSVDSGNVAWPTHYSVRNDQQLHLRVAALGPEGRLYDDFSSLTIEWRSGSTEVAKFESSQACQSLEECVLSISKAESESLDVTATVVGYNRTRLQAQGVHTTPAIHNHQDLSKTVSFTILSSVVLHPAVVHIYAHEDNFVSLSTFGGSGIFEFQSNSTSTVALRDDSGSASVRAIPLQAGTAKITAVDRCLCSSRRAVSIVHVSEISSIRLKIADMMPVGAELELEVLVYDAHGNKFDDSQYPFMGLTSHVENEAILDLVPITVSRFRVHGLSAGQGRISFSGVQGSGQVVSSPSKLIHVYPPFHLIPEKELVLLPSVSNQVDWEGGPPVGAKVSFSIENDRIATVDSIGVVTAKSIGETTLHGHVEAFDSVSGERTRFGEDSIRIIVKKLDGIRILAPSSKVVAGTEMTLRVVGLNGENPFSFASSAVRFAWDTSNFEVASLAPVYQLANVSLPAEGMFSVRFKANKLGQTRVTAFVQAAPDQLGMRGLSASAQISVVEELELLSPARLLLSPFATYQIRTSLDGSVVYSTVCPGCGNDDSEPICSVSSAGVIEVGNRSGSSLVMVEHLETGQRVYVQVEAKPVDMVQLLLAKDGQRAVHYSMPVGASMLLDAVFRDNLGRPFDQLEDTPLKFTTSNREVIAMGKVSAAEAGSRRHQVVVDALQPGEALLQVAAQSRQTHGLVDFIHILVGNAILPPAPTVHVGGEISFSTSYESSKSSNRDPGHWRSDNPTVLEVDASTGKARARKAGTATVEHVGRVTTTTFVVVAPIEEVRLDIASLDLVTNYEREAEYVVPVSFIASGSVELGKDSPAVHNHVHYSCVVQPSLSASARAAFDEQLGHTCVLTLTPSSVTKHQTQPFSDALQLEVVASDQAGSYQRQGKRAIPYYPTVNVVDAPATVQLSSGKLFYRLQVKHGRSEPVLYSSDTSLLSVLRSTKHSDMSTFELGVVDPSQPFDEVVYLQVASTGQKDAIRVVYSISEPASGAVQPMRETGSRAETVHRRAEHQVVQVPPEEELTGMHYMFLFVVTLVAVVLTFLCCTEAGAQLVTRSEPRASAAPATPSTPSAVAAHSRVPAPSTPKTPLFSVPGSAPVGARFSGNRGNMHQRLDFAASPMSPPTPFIQ